MSALLPSCRLCTAATLLTLPRVRGARLPTGLSSSSSLYLRQSPSSSRHKGPQPVTVKSIHTTTSKMSYSVEQRGQLYTESFRLFFKNEAGNVVSPMHDIPLR